MSSAGQSPGINGLYIYELCGMFVYAC